MALTSMIPAAPTASTRDTLCRALAVLGAFCGLVSGCGGPEDGDADAMSLDGGGTEGDPTGGSEDAGEPDGGSQADGGEGSGGMPADAEACDAAPTAGPATFFLDISALPVEEYENDALEVPCAVSSVTADSATWTTELECTLAGGEVVVSSLSVAGLSAGTPAWATGEMVTLRAGIWNPSHQGGLIEPGLEGGSGLEASSAVLRRESDGAFLVGGGRGLGILAPLEVEQVGVCGEVEPCSSDADAPMQATITEPGGESVLLTGGQHVELPLSDATTAVIDAEHYHLSSDCHNATAIQVVGRRVTP